MRASKLELLGERSSQWAWGWRLRSSYLILAKVAGLVVMCRLGRARRRHVGRSRVGMGLILALRLTIGVVYQVVIPERFYANSHSVFELRGMMSSGLSVDYVPNQISKTLL